MYIKSCLSVAILIISTLFPVFAAINEPVDDQQMDALLEEEISWLQAESVIYSAARREQLMMDTASAVFVLSNEDIRRSGVTSVPEALRRVPGLNVAQINANVWAISSRGFNDRTANKLLVMIDGRTVYNPIFSGTIWRTKDVLLEDVDRIEVIRGPGASLWGANAVNGVINVITKTAQKTEGLYATGGGGNQERGFGAVRYGGKMGAKTNYRGYVKYNNRASNKLASGIDAQDNWENLQGGFRIDGSPTPKNTWTLQGDIYTGNGGGLVNNTAPIPPFSFPDDRKENFSGGNILGRWNHTFSDTSAMSLQMYYDRTKDESSSTVLTNNYLQSIINTFDIDFQHNFQFLERHDLTWGLGYRFIADDIHNAVNFSFDPASRDYNLFSAFIQDDFSIIPDKLLFIIGSKFEHNDFSGFEIQPNARLLYTPDSKQSVWASVSRAVRTPNRLDHGLDEVYISEFAPSQFLVGTHNSDFDSEDLIAYELGYRVQPTQDLFIDLAAFYNDYNNLTSAEPGEPFINTEFGTPQLNVPIFPGNQRFGETYGVELAADWQALNWWRLQLGYSFLRVQLHADQDSNTLDATLGEGDSPQHQVMLTSSMDLLDNLEFDTFFRYVDQLPGRNISSYVELDVRLGWHPVEHVELAIVGQNLLHDGHAEFSDGTLTAPVVEIQRSVYGQISFRY